MKEGWRIESKKKPFVNIVITAFWDIVLTAVSWLGSNCRSRQMRVCGDWCARVCVCVCVRLRVGVLF